MGSVKNTGNSSAKSGIYGLQNGVERFSLTENGSFYVGNGNDNFISFNESSRKYDIVTNNGEQTSYKTANTSNALMIKTNKFILNTDKLNINSTATGTNSVIKFDDKFELRANGSASIGSWDIQTNSLTNEFEKDYYTGTKEDKYNKANIVFSTTGNFILPWESSSNIYKYTDDSGKTQETGGIRVATKIGDNFGVTSSGKLYAKEGNFNGTITSTEGKIGNWKISSNGLIYDVDDNDIYFYISPGQYNHLMRAYSKTTDTTYFRVSKNGKLYANEADITGTLTATNLILKGNATVDAAKVTGTLSAAKISANNITSGTINANTITVNNLSASNLTRGTIGSSIKIATWHIDSNSIYQGNWSNYTTSGLVFMCTGSTGNLTLGGHEGTNWIFGCYPNFGVNWNGELYASGGMIGGWKIFKDITLTKPTGGYYKISSGLCGETFSGPGIDGEHQADITYILTPSQIIQVEQYPGSTPLYNEIANNKTYDVKDWNFGYYSKLM